jgi:cyanophycinase-like exopeptidase
MTRQTPAVTQDPGPIALVGSGEYLPSMLEVEAGLIDGRPLRYVQIATAAAPEGDDVLARWHRLGREQAERLGAEQVILDIRTREDALDPAHAALVDGAGLIYLSGGNPSYLAKTLEGTATWSAIVSAWQGGAALAGCSAGAMVMARRIPSLRHPVQGGSDGLGLLPHLRVIPHFDQMTRWMPESAARHVLHGDDVTTLIGVDDETAIVGGPHSWTVQGHQSAWLLEREGRTELPVGTTFEVPDRP